MADLALRRLVMAQEFSTAEKERDVKVPAALRPPAKSRDQRWVDQARRAMEARRFGADLRRGKMKSFRPIVGRI